eukprot:11204978-Lingulodinium_polyedra.AAC.1
MCVPVAVRVRLCTRAMHDQCRLSGCSEATREKLETFLRQFSTGTSAQGASPRKSGSASSVTEHTLGRKPPCPRFAELITIRHFKELVDEFYGAQTHDQLKEMTQKLTLPKQAITELASTFSTAIK